MTTAIKQAQSLDSIKSRCVHDQSTAVRHNESSQVSCKQTSSTLSDDSA
eukprot:CAMPEP_0113978970 /NCGR_PEP_ID=MMETSP0328-20130328/2633_1 /TAXON_ID=39455 /ORGANISM="Alexandrium minutum" /LENGTH=48 /assembly_acc=CAM_ASM_000350